MTGDQITFLIFALIDFLWLNTIAYFTYKFLTHL